MEKIFKQLKVINKRQSKYKIHIIDFPPNQSCKLEQILATVIQEHFLEIKKG